MIGSLDNSTNIGWLGKRSGGLGPSMAGGMGSNAGRGGSMMVYFGPPLSFFFFRALGYGLIFLALLGGK